jgi:hypothetical protein
MKDKNKQLMLAAGSKKGDYDPEAPDQWKWVLRHGESATEVAMAWIKSKTTAFHHDSPYCVDDQGKPLYIPHMATDLGWREQTARNILTVLESQGRARFNGSVHAAKAKRIWYCADVPQAHQEMGEQKGNENNSVQSYLPAYVADFIEKLPAEKRPAALAKWEANVEWRREFTADGMAELRAIADRVEDTTLLEIGLPKKRLPKREKPEAAVKPRWVQIKLFQEPNFVQSCVAEFVQNGNSTSYKPPADFVDARASYSTAAATEEARHPSVGVPYIKEQPSVGRSASPNPTHSTDRPEFDIANFYKPKLRDWLEHRFKRSIPGYDLEEEQLDQIAATILTDAHLEQFQKAAEKQKDPRGWKVFVKIAQRCEQQHGKYEKAMSASAGGDELMEEILRSRGGPRG